MAGYNELLIGRWNRFFQKLTGIKGSKPVQSLGPEVMPVHTLFHGVENRYIEGWGVSQGQAFVAAVAAAFGIVRLRNPPNSGVIAVVESIVVHEAQADTIFLGWMFSPTVQLPAGAAQNRVLFDSRGGSTSSSPGGPSAISFFSGTNASQTPNGATIFRRQGFNANLSGEMILTDNQEIPMPPDTALDVIGGTVNVILSVTIRWRERALEESERT